MRKSNLRIAPGIVYAAAARPAQEALTAANAAYSASGSLSTNKTGCYNPDFSSPTYSEILNTQQCKIA